MLTVHVSRNEVARWQMPIGPSVARLVFLDPLTPPTVDAAHVDGRADEPPYLSVHDGGVLVVRGANFAPTGPSGLRCLYEPLEPEAALLERDATLPPPEALVTLPAGSEPAGAVAVPATYI